MWSHRRVLAHHEGRKKANMNGSHSVTHGRRSCALVLVLWKLFEWELLFLEKRYHECHVDMTHAIIYQKHEHWAPSPSPMRRNLLQCSYVTMSLFGAQTQAKQNQKHSMEIEMDSCSFGLVHFCDLFSCSQHTHKRNRNWSKWFSIFLRFNPAAHEAYSVFFSLLWIIIKLFISIFFSLSYLLRIIIILFFCLAVTQLSVMSELKNRSSDMDFVSIHVLRIQHAEKCSFRAVAIIIKIIIIIDPLSTWYTQQPRTVE